MLRSSTKLINVNPQSMMTIKTRIERTSSGRFVVKKANSVDDECSSSEAVSSCSDNDDKLFASKCHHEMNDKCHNSSSLQSFDVHEVDEGEQEEEEEEDSDADLMLDNIDVTFFSDDDNYATPKNDAERMFFEVVESLRYEHEVRIF